MRYRRVRQHVQEFFRRDYLEGTIIAFGVVIFGLAVFATYVTVYAIVHFGDGGGTFKGTTSWLKGVSGTAIAFFSIIALMSYIAAWALVGRRIYRSVRSRRNRA
jgi:hypothetical protein